MTHLKYITITIISIISSLITLQANASMGEENIIPEFIENRGKKRKTLEEKNAEKRNLCGKFPIKAIKALSITSSENFFHFSNPLGSRRKRSSEQRTDFKSARLKRAIDLINGKIRRCSALEEAEEILKTAAKDNEDVLLFLARAYKAIIIPENSTKETLESFKASVSSSEAKNEKEHTIHDIHDVLDEYVNLLEKEAEEKKSFARVDRLKGFYYKFYSEKALHGDVAAKKELLKFYYNKQEAFYKHLRYFPFRMRAKNLFFLGLEYLHGKQNESEDDNKANHVFGIDLLKQIRKVKQEGESKGVINSEIAEYFSLSSLYLAKAFYLGTAGIPRNYEEAAIHLTVASYYGAPLAKSLLAAMYYDGSGVEKSRVRALKLLEELKAMYGAERPGICAEDSRLLGRIYQKKLGKNKFLYKQDYEKAMLNYKEAIDKGDNLAKYYLCKMLNKRPEMIGIIARKTREANLEYKFLPEQVLRKKVLEDVMFSCWELFYSFYWAVCHNPEFRDTSQYGRHVHKLGRMYENGWGCEKNTEFAKLCYDSAKSNGYYKKSELMQTDEPNCEPSCEPSEPL